MCENPLMLVLLNVVMHSAATDYCEDAGCVLDYFTIDPETCSLVALKC